MGLREHGLVELDTAAGGAFDGPVGNVAVAMRLCSSGITGLRVSAAHAKTGSQRRGDQHVAVRESGR
jgi:hypothetical protein